MVINNSKIVICWGFSPTIANNSTATKTLPYTYTTTYIPIATHYWASGECAWNHVILVGKINVSTIQFRQARLVNSDTATVVGSYITIGY